MNFKQVFVVYNKELKDILRDKRTLISMVLVPLLLFPLLTGGLGRLMSSQIDKIEKKNVSIVVLGSEHAPKLLDYFAEKGNYYVFDNIFDSTAALKLLSDRVVQAVVIVPAKFENKFNGFFGGDGNSDSLHLVYDRSEVESEVAYDGILKDLQNYRGEMVSRELERLNIRRDMTTPFWIYPVNAATQEKMGGFIAGMMMPYMIILLSIMGAMYPAIDLTAGEKERGTLETLLVSPVGRMEMVLGKFLTIMTASLSTATLSLLSLYATVSSGMIMPSAEAMTMTIKPAALFGLILMMIPLAGLFSALLMTIAVFARSYREAQTYISPLMIVAILPAMASLIPGVNPDLQMALIPVLNVSMTLKEVLMGRFDYVLITVTTLSNIVYAAFAIFVSFRMFQKESVLFRV